MKVLVINQPFVKFFCRTQRWAARTRGRVLRPPEWLAYASAVLRDDGHEVKLFDFPALDWEKDRLAPLIRRERPDAVVLDSTTPSIFSDIDCARIVKDNAPGVQVYMVGPHCSAEPEDTLRRSEGVVDAVCLGEYDYTVRDLCRGPSDLADVPGIAYLENGEMQRTLPRALIHDVDNIPFPAYEHINIWDYFDGGKLYPYLSIISGRGCPYGCTYCVWPQVMHGRGYRLRSAENVVDEMQYMLKLFPGLRWGEFFFEDDTFGANNKRAAEVCEEILRRNLKINWSVNSRVDTYRDPELLKLMKRAGCWKLLVGFESGDPDTLVRVDKGASVDDGRQLMEAAKAAKMDVHGCFVLGFPGEDERTMQRTIDFALSLGLHTAQFTAAVPYPGTKLYDECQRDGLLAAESWEDWLTNGEQTGVIELPGLPKQTIEKYVDQGLRRFYFRPSYMLRFFANTRSVSDFYRKARGFYNYASYIFSDAMSNLPGRRSSTSGSSQQQRAA